MMLFFKFSFILLAFLVSAGLPNKVASNSSSGLFTLRNVIFSDTQEKYKSQLEQLTKILTIRANPSEKVCMVNEYIDDLLKNLDDYVVNNVLEPIGIPGFDASFDWLLFNGWIRLKSGSLNGMSTIERTGDVVLKYSYPNLKIRAPLGFSDLKYTYNYDMKFMSIGPSGKAGGTSRGNKFIIDLNINMVSLLTKLERFDLNTLGSVTLKFSGYILTDWIVNLVISVTMPILKPILSIVIESYVVDGVEYVVSSFNRAVCEVLEHCSQEFMDATNQKLRNNHLVVA